MKRSPIKNKSPSKKLKNATLEDLTPEQQKAFRRLNHLLLRWAKQQKAEELSKKRRPRCFGRMGYHANKSECEKCKWHLPCYQAWHIRGDDPDWGMQGLRLPKELFLIGVLTNLDRLILAFIAIFKDPPEHFLLGEDSRGFGCFVSAKNIAREINASLFRVKRSIQKLEGLGMIVIEEGTSKRAPHLHHRFLCEQMYHVFSRKWDGEPVNSKLVQRWVKLKKPKKTLSNR